MDTEISGLMPIKTFSELTRIKQSTLRYYDEVGLFQPAVRGVNDYRYYTPQQIITLNFVNVMTELKVPLKTVGELVRNRTPEMMQELLHQQEALLNAELRRLATLYSLIHTYRSQINHALDADESQISLVYLDAMPIIMGDINDFGDDETFYRTFINFCRNADRCRINLAFPVGGIFTDAETFFATPSQPTRFFSLDPSGTELWPEGRYLVGYNRGYYGETFDLPERMAAYAKEHEMTFDGPVFNIYVLDEVSVRDPDSYLLKVCIPVSHVKGKIKG